ncbi:MAG: flagellar assembly protein FliW [bacterium]
MVSEVAVTSGKIKVKTRRWGEIEIDRDELVVFERGIPGFERSSQYALLQSEDTLPFYWLIGIEDPDLAFVLIDPQLFMPEYKPKLYESDLLELRTEGQDNLVLVAIVTVAADPSRSTANLQGPLLINTSKKLGKQIIVANEEFSTRHPIIKTDRNPGNGKHRTKAQKLDTVCVEE